MIFLPLKDMVEINSDNRELYNFIDSIETYYVYVNPRQDGQDHEVMTRHRFYDLGISKRFYPAPTFGEILRAAYLRGVKLDLSKLPLDSDETMLQTLLDFIVKEFRDTPGLSSQIDPEGFIS